jgi:hypothetical protein
MLRGLTCSGLDELIARREVPVDRTDPDAGLLRDLGARVDLIPAAGLKPGVRERVEPDLVAL